MPLQLVLAHNVGRATSSYVYVLRVLVEKERSQTERLPVVCQRKHTRRMQDTTKSRRCNAATPMQRLLLLLRRLDDASLASASATWSASSSASSSAASSASASSSAAVDVDSDVDADSAVDSDVAGAGAVGGAAGRWRAEILVVVGRRRQAAEAAGGTYSCRSLLEVYPG
eukprot:CAMPEP_0178479256 /NCGR_PEP_ID=MMETSP0696-20121128/5083_1 /TAXON_ID=265572 /ORGANISM="Extubocellulus spinifer, Strain CCMP396" /LENGTH=169 /DNA_ID=CAMNT_0020106653 /DNA_START=124 /DNA_END=633 /DNA_ORIENTATION=-